MNAHMKLHDSRISLSASDLADHLGCRHLPHLNLRVSIGELTAPSYADPAREALQRRGEEHEAAYVQHLMDQGLPVTELPGQGNITAEFEATRHAMREGRDVIVQATLLSPGWQGRADALLRVETPSSLGPYSYEVADAKLARETRGRTILQLCLYSDILREVQGTLPEKMHVVPPGKDFVPETFRVDDYMAYYRHVRSRLATSIGGREWLGGETYPNPCEQCGICRWWSECDQRRHDDDHLSLVAGISKLQIAELEDRSIQTLKSLATISLPLDPPPARGAPETYERVHHQARVQLQERLEGHSIYEMLPLKEGFGLFQLPEPTTADVFLDFEGAQFVGTEGLEYLLGYVSLDDAGEPRYRSMWALAPEAEKVAFEQFIDDAMVRWEANEGFHIYHYAPYEPAAMKRLMGRHATREGEVDRLLRGERFVDLYAVVRHSIRASVESYSIKDLERFFGYERDVDLREASRNLRILEYALEFEAQQGITDEIRNAVEGYNRDDCLSAHALRNWLERLRDLVEKAGHQIPRPEHSDGMPSEKQDEIISRVRELAEKLTQGIPVDRRERADEQQAEWILAQLLEWHRREDKALWWEYFRLVALSDEELLDERNAIGKLEFVERVGRVGRGSVIDRYRFPHQETKLCQGDDVLATETGTTVLGEIVQLDAVRCFVDLKKGPSKAEIHPPSVFVHEIIGTQPLRESLFRIGEWVVEHGIDSPGSCRAGRDLLMGRPPRLRGEPVEAVADDSVTPLAAARSLILDLDHGLLPIQGPPGSGKTYTGGRMICEAAAAGLKVGITAVSHKVIRNLLDEAVEAAQEIGIELHCVQKVSEKPTSESLGQIVETDKNSDVFDMLENGKAQVAAGTAWLWAREEAADSVDVLFVDEAGQISLANTLAVSQAASSVVLLGDPRQLEQPKRGSHPDGTDVSALKHLLGEHQTMPPDRGLFLPTTWRLHPSICRFTSELFYERRLQSREGLDVQAVLGESTYRGAGLWLIPVEHEGNCNESPEEVDVVAQLVAELTRDGMEWMDRRGGNHPITITDVLIVAPYNAHVAAILQRLPAGARVGTVDRFQGQEAPIVIYSMATSSPDLAPRGMEFLYSPSRLNVATSRAQCVCILVANPRLFEPECHSPQQMRFANAFCRYKELANPAAG